MDMEQIVFEKNFCPDADVAAIQDIESIAAFKEYISSEFQHIAKGSIENSSKERLFAESDMNVCLYAVKNTVDTKCTGDERTMLRLLSRDELYRISEIVSTGSEFLVKAATAVLTGCINPFDSEAVWKTIRKTVGEGE